MLDITTSKRSGSEPGPGTVVNTGIAGEHGFIGTSLENNGAVASVGRVIALVDGSAFSRDCIAKALTTVFSTSAIVTCATVEELIEVSETPETINLVLLNAHARRVSDPVVEQALLSLRQTFGTAAIILIADIDSGDRVIEALGRGVRGYIPTSASFSVAIEAMRLVEAGGTFIPASSLLNYSDAAKSNGSMIPNGPQFTQRQLAVLNRIREGKANKIIAHELAMSESTVKVHVRNIMHKLKATNRTEVAFRTRSMFRADE